MTPMEVYPIDAQTIRLQVLDQMIGDCKRQIETTEDQIALLQNKRDELASCREALKEEQNILLKLPWVSE